MSIEIVQQYARERGLSKRDAAQTLMQILVLRHIAVEKTTLIGGTALVLGDGNPRFSEDIDLTGLENPLRLREGLQSAKVEVGRFFNCEVRLTAPKQTGRTWRLVAPLESSDSLRLHIDTQPYPAQTVRPVIVRYPAIPAFVFGAARVEEIMADKVIAVALRRYLGGRDLFDLWFHWLSKTERGQITEQVQQHLQAKLKQRSLSAQDLLRKLSGRLTETPSLERARQEWERYLTTPFQKESVYQEIITACRNLKEIFYDLG